MTDGASSASKADGAEDRIVLNLAVARAYPMFRCGAKEPSWAATIPSTRIAVEPVPRKSSSFSSREPDVGENRGTQLVVLARLI